MNDVASPRLLAALQALALDIATAEVVTALETRDICSVLLKGPAIAHWLYADDHESRTYLDIDVLVAPEDFEPAEAVLRDLGYDSALGELRRIQRAWLPVTPWVRAGASLAQVDLHRGFHGVRDFDNFWRVMSDPTVKIHVQGKAVDVPDAAGCALVVTLHDTAVGRTVQSGHDLDRALTRFDDSVWSEAAQRAEQTGALDSFVLGLSRHEGGTELIERLGLRADRLIGTAIRGLAAADSDPRAAHAAVTLLGRFGADATLGARVRALLDIVFPSADYLRALHPLARRGRLGLLAARAIRPFAVLARTPRVVALLLAGRRIASSDSSVGRC